MAQGFRPTDVDLDVVGEGIPVNDDDLHEHWPQARLQLIDRLALGEQRMEALERSDQALHAGLTHLAKRLTEVSEANALNVSLMGQTARAIESTQAAFHQELRTELRQEHQRRNYRTASLVAAVLLAAIVIPTWYWALTR